MFARVLRLVEYDPLALYDSPSVAIAIDSARDLREQLGQLGVTVRVGLHAGEVEVQADGDISGLAANLGARIEQNAPDGAICVSATVHDLLLGGGIEFTDLGPHELKGFDGAWRLYEFR